MTPLTDPTEIGEARFPREIKPGWHVRLRDGREVLVDNYVLPTAGGILLLGRTVDADGRYELREHELSGATRWWTRTPAEQVQYVEALHRRLIAGLGAHNAVLSAAKPAACERPECLAAHAEVARLLGVIDALHVGARVGRKVAP